MATIKLRRAAAAGASLAYGEIAIGNNELYFGNSSNSPIRVAKASELNSYLPLSAGSGKNLIGDLYHRGSLVSTDGTNTSTWMQFTPQVNGNALYLGSGALTVIGGGESVSQIKANISSTEEAMVYGSDSETTSIAHRFITSLQSG